MNQLIVKKIMMFSLILGACLGLLLQVPSYTLQGLTITVLMFLVSAIIILYMKKNEKHLGIINNQQGAIIGGIAGFFGTLGAFISYIPLAYIIYIFNHNYYYGNLINSAISTAFWLLILITFMFCIIFALTNSATGMGLAFLLNYFEKKPEDSDLQIDIEIND